MTTFAFYGYLNWFRCKIETIMNDKLIRGRVRYTRGSFIFFILYWDITFWFSAMWGLNFPMAMATLPLFHQLLTLSNPKSATILRPRLPTSQRTFHLSILCCSSTSQSPEANLQSAESSINIGLELFSKGRVCVLFRFVFSCFLRNGYCLIIYFVSTCSIISEF